MKSPRLVSMIAPAVTLALQLSTLCSSSRAAAGDVDPSFDAGSGVDGQVNVVAVQPDGKVIIGGAFLTVKGLLRPHLALLNADGTGDPTFNAGTVVNNVSAIAVQPDGKVICARDVYDLSLHPPGSDLRRLNSDGSLDGSFHSDTGAYVLGGGITCMAAQPDGKVVLGGYFYDQFQDEAGLTHFYRRSLLMRVNADGSADHTFARTSGPYNAGSREHTTISSLALQPDGKIVIVGLIDTRVNNSGRYGIARHHADGSRDHGFEPAVDGFVNSVLIQSDGKILLGGESIGNFPPRNGLARINSDGSLDEGFDPATHPETVVISMVQQPDGKLVLNSYLQINDVRYVSFQRLNADGTVDGGFNPGTGPGAPDNGGVAIALMPGGKMFVAGSFTTFDGTPRERIARLHADGSLDQTFDPGAGIGIPFDIGSVGSLVIQPDGEITIGGKFGRVGGTKRNSIARLHANGALDTSFDPGPGIDDALDSLEIAAMAAHPNGQTLIGGDFSSVNGATRRWSARLKSDGSLDADFIPGPGAHSLHVSALVVQHDGKVLIGGNTAAVNGSNFHGISRLHVDGSLDVSFHPDVLGATGGTYAVINAIAVQPDGKLLLYGYYVIVGGGEFDFYGYLVTRLDPDGTPDASFKAPHVSGDPWFTSFFTASAVALQPDGKVLIGGNFSTVDGEVRNGIVRLNADGSLDDGFQTGSGVNGEFSPAVTSIEVQPDGRILIAGTFLGFNGSSRYRIARLNANGSVDSTFIPGTGADGEVRAMALQPDGNIIISGEFRAVNGIVRPRIARLFGGTQPPASFAAWAMSFGLTGTDATADADTDHDGMPNGVEYILGEHPLVSHPTVPPGSPSARPSATVTDGKMLFTFLRDDASKTPDVALTVETGTELITWPSVFAVGSTGATSSPGVSIAENGEGPDSITVTIPAGTATRRFARLKVTITP